MRRDRLVDCGMVADRKPVRVWHVDGRGALVDQPLDQNVVDRREDRVSGDHGQLVVEGDIGADELRRIAHRGDVGVERRFKPRDIFFGRTLRRLPGDAGLEQKPCLLHMGLTRVRAPLCA